MKDYFFYKIVCNDLSVKNAYVGSTENFTIRKSAHKNSSTNPKKAHQKIYATMAENGGWNCWSMVLIETRSFETRLEAKRLERFHYEQLNSDHALNMISPQRDYEEGLAYYKKYYKNNKEKYAAYRKEYHAENKAALDVYGKEYYAENKEHIAVLQQQYKENNKAAITAHNNVKHECACGGRYTRINLQQHIKSQKHQKYIEQIKK